MTQGKLKGLSVIEGCVAVPPLGAGTVYLAKGASDCSLIGPRLD